MATLYEITKAMVDLLRDNWSQLDLEGPDDVYYGDQPRLAHHPSITVEGSVVERPLTGTGMVTTKTTTLYIMLYHSSLSNVQIKREELDQYLEGVLTIIHANKTLNGSIIHGHVVRDEVGIADRSGTLMNTIRLQYQAITRESIWS